MRIAIATLALGACAALAVAAPGAAQTRTPVDPRKIVAPPLKPIPVVRPERFTLKNGLVVFLLENHDLPVVSGSVYVRSTPSWISDDRVGLGTVTGQVMRSGGTARHPGDWLDDRLAAIGASISANIGLDLASGGFRCLAGDVDEVIGLFAEVLRQPAFPEDKIELAKVGLRRSVASRNDEMIPLLVRVAGQAVYGKGSPFARTVEYATIEAIQRDDLTRLHAQVFEPSRMVLAVYGDFGSADMKKRLARVLGDWKGSGAPAPVLPPTPERAAPRLVFAPKEDVTQSGIIVAQRGVRVDDPDYPALEVLFTALGGGFQSRLVNRIRSERGLAYATGAGVGADYQRPGVFTAYSLTKSESTMVALDLLREEVRRVTEAPLTDEELAIAKESVLNTHVFNFEEPSSSLFRAAYYHVLGYPQDFLHRYQQGVQAVTAASVLEAARRQIDAGRLQAIVVGKEKEFDRPLESVGLPVERMDISIPPPPSRLQVGAASPEAREQGRALLARAAERAGGAAAWAAVKTVAIEEQQTLTMQGQSMALTSRQGWALPDRFFAVRKLPMGEMKQGFDGTAGWMSMMGQIQDQPKVAEQVREEYERSFFRLFGHPEAVEIQAMPAQTIDGVAYQVGFVKSELVKDWTLYFDPDGFLARMEYQGEGPQGPARVTEIYSEWKPQGGLHYPHQSRTLVDGQPLMEGKLTSFTPNATLDEAEFKKPSN
jgi:zinc protease